MIFKFEDIDDFDKHIDISIPNYSGLIDICSALFLEFMPAGGICVDIGCSTGKLISDLSKKVRGEYIGVDICDLKGRKEGFKFIKQEAHKYLETNKSDVIFSIFTLQFMDKHTRAKTVAALKLHVKNGGVVFLAEKVFMDCPKINNALQREHYKKKRDSFTDNEILDKDYQLLGSMFCKTESEIEKEVSFVGDAYKVWQSYNFNGWIIK